MEASHFYDTISIMEKYNFHQPIQSSILYLDDVTEPRQAIHLENYESTRIQNNNNILIPTTVQKNVSMTKMPINNGMSKQNLSNCRKNVTRKDIARVNPRTKNAHTRKNTCKTDSNNLSKRQNSNPYCNPSSEVVSISQVAENMTLIMEAYTYYNKFFTKTSDIQFADRIKQKYIKIKYYYFYKTLPISKQLLLLHENNQQFIDDIYSNVKRITKVSFPYEYFINLYRDMLKWTKYKICQMTNSTIIAKQSNEVFSLVKTSPIVTTNPGNVNNDKSLANIFSSGPPDNSVTISVDQNILNQYRNDCATSNGETFVTTRNSCGQNLVTNVTNQANQPEIDYDTHYNSHSSYFNTEDIPSQDWQSSSQRIPPPSGSSCFLSQRQFNNYDSLHNNSIRNYNFHSIVIDDTDSDVNDTARNSISRDSGFTSPVMSGSPSEQTVYNFQHTMSQYDQDSSALQMSNILFQPNITSELAQSWNY